MQLALDEAIASLRTAVERFESSAGNILAEGNVTEMADLITV
jgi:hypothetical protein